MYAFKIKTAYTKEYSILTKFNMVAHTQLVVMFPD